MVVPYTTHERIYDQRAVYLVKSNKKMRFGLLVNDLSSEKRIELERNTGAVVSVVLEDSPAFFSNVLVGDVLISIDGNPIKNASHAVELMSNVQDGVAFSELTVIRNGSEKVIKINF